METSVWYPGVEVTVDKGLLSIIWLSLTALRCGQLAYILRDPDLCFGRK